MALYTYLGIGDNEKQRMIERQCAAYVSPIAVVTDRMDETSVKQIKTMAKRDEENAHKQIVTGIEKRAASMSLFGVEFRANEPTEVSDDSHPRLIQKLDAFVRAGSFAKGEKPAPKTAKTKDDGEEPVKKPVKKTRRRTTKKKVSK